MDVLKTKYDVVIKQIIVWT